MTANKNTEGSNGSAIIFSHKMKFEKLTTTQDQALHTILFF
jgi:hypothetical protein